jgi:hypothetical protein
MAYVMLCTCRPAGPIRGRGLAWAAIGLSYLALTWHLVLSAPAVPHLKLAALGVLAMGAMHLPIFAAESAFAKNAVATLLISGTFLSLLFLWLHYTREESRRLRCLNNLRQIGTELHNSVTFDRGSEQRWTADSFRTDSVPQWPSWITQVQPTLDNHIAPPKRYTIPTDSYGAGAKTNVYQQEQPVP